MSVSQSDLIRYLNEYLFNTVWNSVASEYRVNLSLNLLNPRLQTNVVSTKSAVVGLPTTDTTYMTYYFSYTLLEGSTPLVYNQWTSLNTILNETQTWLTVYDQYGQLVPMSQCYLYLFKGSNEVLVAVAKSGLWLLKNQLQSSLYLSAMKDATLVDPISVTSWRIPVGSSGLVLQHALTDVANQITWCQKNSQIGTIVFINGFNYDLGSLPALQAGDFIDIVLDMNVYAEYNVNVSDTSTGYQSTLYGGYREILHCPKALNPNHWIFTHDSAFLCVRDSSSGRGVYLHYQDPVSVEPITHNDFSVSRNVLNALQAGLNAVSITVNVKIRTPAKPHVLTDDACFLKDLYLLDDATIIGHLQGVLDSTLTFWQASYMEQSSFISLMYNNVDVLNPSRLSLYVDALGYYRVGSILASNLYETSYQNANMIITKPLVMTNEICTPLLFVNGRKVIQNNISYYDLSSTKMELFFDASVNVTTTNTVDIKLFTGNPLISHRLSPTIADPTSTHVILTDANVNVWQETVLSQSQQGYQRSVHTSYHLIAQSPATYNIYSNGDGTSTLIFQPGMYNNTYIIQPVNFMYYESWNIDTLLSAGQPLVFAIYTGDNTGVNLPILTYGSIEVFINGYQLVRDVDFVFQPLLINGEVCMTDLVITNRNFLNFVEYNNIVEVFIHSDVELSRDQGYVVNNILYRSDRPSIWMPEVGHAFVEGIAIDHLQDEGLWMVSPTTLPNGALFQMSVIFPRYAFDTLSAYSSVSEQQRLSIIDTYLGRTTPALPTVIPVSQEHKLYSPYLTAIIYDVVNGHLMVTNDPNESSFLLQFQDYAYLRDRDPTLVNGNAIDRRFVAVASAYAQPKNTTVENTIILQRLITYTLVRSNVSLGETLV